MIITYLIDADLEKKYLGIIKAIQKNLWSVIKRALRYIYRDLTFNPNDLELILRKLEKRT